ncbi:MAG TPA: radical SAM protein [Armatimonadota bacterium]
MTKKRIQADLNRLFGTIMGVAQGACPAEVGLPSQPIEYADWTAPARMDLALTYRCNLRCPKCYLPAANNISELPAQEWKQILAILWKLGIPQVVFTGGEPTLRDDLIDLVKAADHFVTGLVTNGTTLVELATPLHEASLDYAQVTIESDDPEVHDRMTTVSGSHARTTAGIRQALATGLQVVTNTTLTKENGSGFPRTLRWLAEIGVRHIACNTLICSGRGIRFREEQGLTDEELQPILRAACAEAGKLDVVLQWYSPTCYSQGINPLELGFGAKSCSAAAHNMTIQPDGSVLPCQSWPGTVGNILTDEWPAIWNHPTCRALRSHLHQPAECRDCTYVSTCGGGCPLDNAPRRPAGEGGRS